MHFNQKMLQWSDVFELDQNFCADDADLFFRAFFDAHRDTFFLQIQNVEKIFQKYEYSRF